MPPVAVNRRRFLGCSAAASLAISQGMLPAVPDTPPVRVGVVGLGTRGTTLLRGLLELPGVQIASLCDAEGKHRTRGAGIVEKAKRDRPRLAADPDELLEQADLDAVAVALPCDRHADVYAAAIRAGKHLYAEKPLALTLAECDLLIDHAAKAPSLVVHVGHQRRSNPRHREGIASILRGELGTLIHGTASWVSSNGPMNGHDGWLARRDRSGDWMVEQAVHIWDVFNWLAGGPPARAFGQGRRDLFVKSHPSRDVTDHYTAQLEWPDGFHATFLHSWAAPADDRFTGVSQRVMGSAGGFDFATGALTVRDRSVPRRSIHPGAQPDTKLALKAFLAAIRAQDRAAVPPPLSLSDARDALLTGLLVRKAVDEHRVVSIDEILSDAAPAAQT
jgi:predicted dehydrogenase